MSATVDPCYGCTVMSVSVWRIIPRRLDVPLCLATDRATRLLGQADPVSVPVCGDTSHQQALRDAAQVVLGVEAVGGGILVRMVKDGSG